MKINYLNPLDKNSYENKIQNIKKREDMIKLGIVGSRNFNNYDIFSSKIDEWIDKHGGIESILAIISGGCKGTDNMAQLYAEEKCINTVIHFPNWEKFGKKTGPIRNQLIVDDSTHIIAFPMDNSRGTMNTISLAKKAQKNLTIYKITTVK